MTGSALAVAKRNIEIFNRTFGIGQIEVTPEAREIFADEPLIVPLRAAIDGTVHSGPTALEDFTGSVSEAWQRMNIEPAEWRDLGDGKVMMLGTLTGVGRGSGATTTIEIVTVTEVEDGRIAKLTTCLSEEAAMEAAAK